MTLSEDNKNNRKQGEIILAVIVLLCIGMITFCCLYLINGEPSKLVKNKEIKKANSTETFTDDQNTTKPKYMYDQRATTRPIGVTSKTTSDEVPDYTIRLNKKDNSSSGIVYIQADGREGFVCTDGYDVNAATVTCRELGYEHGLPYNKRVGYYPYTRYTLDEPILSLLNCTGNELKLSDCDGFLLDNETTCTWFTGVVCYNGEYPYELRLVTGSYPDSGLVEIRLGDQWGVFCGIRTFDDEVADILCRNMNYTGGLAVTQTPTESVSAPKDAKLWVPYIYCGDSPEVKKTIFDCNLTLHPENVLYDHVDFRSNRGIVEFLACQGDNSHAAVVQCFNKSSQLN